MKEFSYKNVIYRISRLAQSNMWCKRQNSGMLRGQQLDEEKQEKTSVGLIMIIPGPGFELYQICVFHHMLIFPQIKNNHINKLFKTLVDDMHDEMFGGKCNDA